MPTEKSLSVSVVIIAKDEEERLPDCLASVTWAKEVIVVDDESTDQTREIARERGAKIFSQKMEIEGRQRNFGYGEATQPWILSLDADERVTPELAEEIGKKIQEYENDSTVVGLRIPVRTYIGSRWIRGAGYYPAYKARVFRKGRVRFEEARVHPRIFYEGKMIQTKGDILHYSCKDLGEFIRKFNRETTLEAEKWILDGRRISVGKTLRKAASRFFKFYFLRDGWRDGLWGYTMSLFHAFYPLVSYAKYREAKQKKSKGDGDAVVFVDRDGVINEDLFDYVTHWKDFRFHEGVLSGLKRLTDADYKIVLISNQAGVGDGKFSEGAHQKIHEKMLEVFKQEGIQLHAAYFCLHGKNEGCECRKPKPGLFQQAAANGLTFNKSDTYFVGDKITDVEAGKKFGLKTILVRTGYGERHEPACQGALQPDAVVNHFQEAVDRVLCG